MHRVTALTLALGWSSIAVADEGLTIYGPDGRVIRMTMDNQGTVTTYNANGNVVAMPTMVKAEPWCAWECPMIPRARGSRGASQPDISW
jgi:hypothetical protein